MSSHSHSHVHFTRIPFEDFLVFLFNSSGYQHRQPKQPNPQELAQDFVNLNMNTPCPGRDGSKTSTQNRVAIGNTAQTEPRKTTGTYREAIAGASSGVSRTLSQLSHQHSVPQSTTRKLPTIDSVSENSAGAGPLDNNNWNDEHGHYHHHHQDVAVMQRRMSSLMGAIRSNRNADYNQRSHKDDALAFYKNFSAHYGKSRSKSLSSSELTLNCRLCRSAPMPAIKLTPQSHAISLSTPELDQDQNQYQDEAMDFEYADLFDSNEDAAEFLRLHPDFPRNHHGSGGSGLESRAATEAAAANEYEEDEVMDIDGSKRSGLHRSDSRASPFNMLSSSGAGEKIVLAVNKPANTSTSTNAKYQQQQQHKGNSKKNNNSVDLTLNERVEKTMSLYLDAVKFGQRKEYEDSSTSVRLFY